MCIAAIAAVAIFFVIWSGNVQNELNTAHNELTDATGKKSQYDAKVSEIGKVKAQIASTETKQNFIASAQKYNAAWPEVFSLIRDLTSKYVLLKNMAFTETDHKTIRLSAFAGTEEAIADWWTKLRNRNDIFDNVTMQYPGRPYHPASAAGVAGGMGMPGSGGMGMPGSGGMGMPGSGGAAGGDAVGPATIEDRPGINFIATLVLKTPLDNGAAVPVWTGVPGAVAPAGGTPAVGKRTGAATGGSRD